MLDKETAVLVVIDFQDKLLNKISGAEAISDRAVKLIQFAYALKLPILCTEQYPAGLGPTNAAVKAVLGDAPIIEKLSFGCLGEPKFLDALQSTGRNQLLITGIETHVCVMQTALAALEEGYDVFVVCDAVGSRFEGDYEAGLARMRRAGVQLVTAEMAIFETLRAAGTPEFKRVLPLVK